MLGRPNQRFCGRRVALKSLGWSGHGYARGLIGLLERLYCAESATRKALARAGLSVRGRFSLNRPPGRLSRRACAWMGSSSRTRTTLIWSNRSHYRKGNYSHYRNCGTESAWRSTSRATDSAQNGRPSSGRISVPARPGQRGCLGRLRRRKKRRLPRRGTSRGTW
jgi:hypothetical protein